MDNQILFEFALNYSPLGTSLHLQVGLGARNVYVTRVSHVPNRNTSPRNEYWLVVDTLPLPFTIYIFIPLQDGNATKYKIQSFGLQNQPVDSTDVSESLPETTGEKS